MELQFEQGDSSAPRGHALVYFTDASDSDRVAASYIVVLPVDVDIAKYVPPFLSGQIESIGGSDMSSFSFPPAPEPVDGLDSIRSLASRRGDDLLFGGARNLGDAANLMGLVGEITSEYKRLYDAATELEQPAGEIKDGDEEPIDDFLYGLLEEADLLNEVSSLVGKLRYALEGGDSSTARECELRIRAAGRFMPENRKAGMIADAAAGRMPNADLLARLYIERAYGLLREDYRAVQDVESRIKQLSESEPESGETGQPESS